MWSKSCVTLNPYEATIQMILKESQNTEPRRIRLPNFIKKLWRNIAR